MEEYGGRRCKGLCIHQRYMRRGMVFRTFLNSRTVSKKVVFELGTCEVMNPFHVAGKRRAKTSVRKTGDSCNIGVSQLPSL
jgi:hypothetical protein